MAGDKDKSGSMGPNFDTLDVNRDGRISQAEAGVDAGIAFSSADRNGAGYVDKTEWKNREESTTPPVSEPKPDTETPRQ